MLAMLGSTAAPFDPTTIPWSDWRTPNFPGLPWPGTASAGSSGSSVEGASVFGNTTAPIAGRIINGFTSARYSSGAKGSSAGNAGGHHISPSQYAISTLFYAETLGASGGATPYAEAFLYGEFSGYGFQKTISADGVKVSRFNGATWDSRVVACGAGAWHLADVRFSAGILEIAIDGGAWVPFAFGNATSSGAGPATGGAIYNIASGTDFDLVERGVADVTLDDATFIGWRSYLDLKYGTAFAA